MAEFCRRCGAEIVTANLLDIDPGVDRGLTVLEIHDFISGEFEPVPLQDVWDYIKAQEASGALKLTTKTAGK